MKNIFFFVLMIVAMNIQITQGQNDKYFWGYKTKYELTVDSLKIIVVPKGKEKLKNIEYINDQIESEQISFFQNRNEILFKLKKTIQNFTPTNPRL